MNGMAVVGALRKRPHNDCHIRVRGVNMDQTKNARPSTSDHDFVRRPWGMKDCPRCDGTGADDSGATYEWGEPIYVKCECTEVSMSEVRNVQKSDSVRVEDGMCSTQLPAKLIVAADTVLGEMCRRGSTSPELRIYYGTRDNLCVWWCEFGAIKCWSSTPWGAISTLARQLEEYRSTWAD